MRTMTLALRVAFLLFALLWAARADAANCFWVGGTGNLNNTAKWASASGGTTGTCAASGGWPNSNSDAAFFDSASGGGTVTRNAAWTVNTIDMSAFTGTLGNAGDTSSVTVITFTNNGSGTRTLNLGASTWTVPANGTWAVTGASNLTLNGNTSTLVLGGSTPGNAFVANLGSSVTYNTVTFSADGGGVGVSWNSSGAITVTTLNIASPNFIAMNNNNNVTVTNLNFTGGTPSITNLATLASTAFGNKFTLTLSNAATCSYCAFRDAAVATSTLTANNSLNLGNVSGTITINAPTVGGGGSAPCIKC